MGLGFGGGGTDPRPLLSLCGSRETFGAGGDALVFAVWLRAGALREWHMAVRATRYYHTAPARPPRVWAYPRENVGKSRGNVDEPRKSQHPIGGFRL